MRPFLLKKLSVIGAFDCVPSSFICWNSGDSCSCMRIHTDTPSRMIDSRNGMRQPHASNASTPTDSRTTRITSSDRNRPIVAVVWMKLVYRPRLPLGACSAT